MHVLVTGATGFIGRPLVHHLLGLGHEVTALVRKTSDAGFPSSSNLHLLKVADLAKWSVAEQALVPEGIEAVVHLAGLAHAPAAHHSSSNEAEQYLHAVNVEATQVLSRQAAAAGVRHFVYMSSVKVHGASSGDHAFTERSPFDPDDIYAESKIAAEQAVIESAESSAMAYTILRPVMIYGAHAKGNFRLITQWLRSGMPIPIDAIHNRRSFLGLPNLLSAIGFVLSTNRSHNEIFILADPEAYSTPDFVRKVARSMRRPSRIFFFPLWLIRLLIKLVGKELEWQKLSSSLVVDMSHARQQLGWKPPYTTQEQLDMSFVDQHHDS
jgi:nucleoside-diphosphate-sugar epimerase